MAVGERQDTGRAAGSSGGGAERLALKIGRKRSFGRGLGSRGHRGAVRGGSRLWFFLDAHQILIRDFPTEMSMLAALLKILFEENGTAGIGHESARSRQKNIAGAILHLHAAPEKGGVASHPVLSV